MFGNAEYKADETIVTSNKVRGLFTGISFQDKQGAR
jgi:hypothetical protein